MNVDGVLGGEPGELVGQADIDIPVCRLGQFGQLGCLRAAQVPDAIGAIQIRSLVEVEDRFVELAGALCAGGRERADQLRIFAQVCEDAPGEHSLRAEHHMEVSPFAEPGPLFEHRRPALAGCPDRQSGLIRNERARGEGRGNVARG